MNYDEKCEMIISNIKNFMSSNDIEYFTLDWQQLPMVGYWINEYDWIEGQVCRVFLKHGELTYDMFDESLHKFYYDNKQENLDMREWWVIWRQILEDKIA